MKTTNNIIRLIEENRLSNVICLGYCNHKVECFEGDKLLAEHFFSTQYDALNAAKEYTFQ